MEIESFLINDGKKYSIILGQIEKTNLGYEEHGIFTAWLRVKGDTWGQVVGGYVLDTTKPDGGGDREGTAYGLDLIIRILETLGVKQWESLIGVDVYLIQNPKDQWGQVLGIVGKNSSKPLFFQDHLKNWYLNHGSSLQTFNNKAGLK